MDKINKKNIYGEVDQLLVRVGKACNFKCIFCNVSDNENNVKLKESITDITRNFHYKLKYSNIDSKEIIVTISGGEPSIFQKETIFALKYIKNFLLKRGIHTIFEIQTNASNIDLKFAKLLKANDVSLALVSFHMIDKNIFEKVINVSFETYFKKIIDGIKKLNSVGIEIDTNTIISRDNSSDFFKTIMFLNNKFNFIRHFNIGIIQPHGEAYKILDKISVKYEDISYTYNKAISYLLKNQRLITSHYVGLPLCYLERHGIGLELGDNKIFRRNYNFSNKHLINNINDNNKIQTKDCNNCLYNNVCSGIWKEYVGLQKLKPVNITRDFFGEFIQNSNSYKLKNSSENLKKFYDKNIRHIIIPTSIGNKSDIINITKLCLMLGFYKITLLVNSKFDLDIGILEAGIGNIQIDIENIKLDFIKELIDFSEKNKPQFRVDLDIFVKNYNKDSIIILKELIKLLPNNFIKIFFIKYFNNKEIYKYDKLLSYFLEYNNNVFSIDFYKILLYKN